MNPPTFMRRAIYRTQDTLQLRRKDITKTMERRIKEFIQHRLLTTEELAEYTGYKAATIKQWVQRGKVDFVLKGRTCLFDRRDFAPKYTSCSLPKLYQNSLPTVSKG